MALVVALIIIALIILWVWSRRQPPEREANPNVPQPGAGGEAEPGEETGEEPAERGEETGEER